MAERNNANMMGATIMGGLIGASLAMLFAPRSGKETRRQIHDSVEQVKDEARQLKARLREAAHQATSEDGTISNPSKQDKPSKRRQSPVLTAWEEEV